MTTKNKLIVLLAGNAGAGKDAFAGFLGDRLHEIGLYLNSDFRVDAYANTLKQCVHLKTGIPMDILMGPKDVKESFVEPLTGKTVRQLCQDEGESTRQVYGHKIWAYSAMMRAKRSRERVTIITDARHPAEEIEWMREICSEFALVFALRVTRADMPVKRGHPSEDLIADAPDSLFDFLVPNDGSLTDLRTLAADVADAIMLLAQRGKTKLPKDVAGYSVLHHDNRIGRTIRGWPYTTLTEAETIKRSYEDPETGDPNATVIELKFDYLKGNACP